MLDRKRTVTLVAVVVATALLTLFLVDRIGDHKSGSGFQEVESASYTLAAATVTTAAATSATSATAITTQATADRCRRPPRVCRVITHAKRIANKANQHHAVREGQRQVWPGDYSRSERRTIRAKRLGITPRKMFRHPHHFINGNDARVTERTYTRVIDGERSNCKELVDERKIETLIFRADLWTFRTRFNWCWRGGKVTYHSGNLQTIQVDDSAVVLNGLIENNDRYYAGTHRRIFSFQRLYSASNCFAKYGCWKSWHPTYQVQVAAGGDWSGEFWWA